MDEKLKLKENQVAGYDTMNTKASVNPPSLRRISSSKIIKFIKEDKAIDIYQYLALIGDQWATEDVYKGIISVLAQIIGICLILYEILTTGIVERGYCNYVSTFEHVMYKILAFVLCSYMSYRGTRLLFHGKGIHKLSKYGDDVTSTLWAWIGFWVNRIVALGVIVGGFMVIFFATSAWIMVLNGVALFTLMDLDDKLIHDDHYVKLHKLCPKQENYSDEKGDETTRSKKVMNIAQHIVHGVCFAASVYVAWCY